MEVITWHRIENLVSKDVHSPHGLQIEGCCYWHKDKTKYPRNTVQGPQKCDESTKRSNGEKSQALKKVELERLDTIEKNVQTLIILKKSVSAELKPISERQNSKL